jgi:hypothetical protein
VRRLIAAGVLALLPACGGGSSSPAAVTPPTTLPPKDGVVVLNGKIGGRFVLSSSPVIFRDGHSFGCGDITVVIPVKETAGGGATGADYEIKILDNTGFSSRLTGKATTVKIAANDVAEITFTSRFECAEWGPVVPPRAQVALNFGGNARGTVSQVSGTGDITIVQ